MNFRQKQLAIEGLEILLDRSNRYCAQAFAGKCECQMDIIQDHNGTTLRELEIEEKREQKNILTAIEEIRNLPTTPG